MGAAARIRPALTFAPATEESTQLMNEDLEHKNGLVIGVFMLTCLAATIFCGPLPHDDRIRSERLSVEHLDVPRGVLARQSAGR